MPQSATHDVIVVGGGPAALGTALYTGRAELKTVVLERRAVGGQLLETDAVENYPGFPEGVCGPELIKLMAAQAKRFGVDMRMEEVSKIELDGDMKIVTTGEGVYRAPVAILAMGADPVKLNVPGEAELRGRGVSYCATCDAPFFRNKKVVVVGGGDSALKEGLFISKFAREMVLVHRRQEFRAEKIYQSAVRSNPKFSLGSTPSWSASTARTASRACTSATSRAGRPTRSRATGFSSSSEPPRTRSSSATFLRSTARGTWRPTAT